MNTQFTECNIQIIAAGKAGKKHRLQAPADFRALRIAVQRICLGVVLSTSVIPAVHAQLSGDDLEAAKAYFANNPEIPSDKQNEILRKNDLIQVSDYLKNNTYWNGSSNVQMPVFDPLARMETPMTQTATLPMTNLTPAEHTISVAQPPVKNDPTGTPVLLTPIKNDPTGIPVDVQTQMQKKQAEQVALRYAAANAPHDGLDGKDGIDGKDGAKGDTGLAGTDGKDADMSKVNANSEAIQGDEMAEANRQRTSMQHVDVVALAQTAQDSTQKTQAETKKQIAAAQAKVAHEQQIEHIYYDQQIQQLAAGARAEVLAESHSRAAGDARTLAQANDYTNKRFSDLKTRVDDNKKEAAAGSASAMAQANIPQVQESQQFAVGAGVGGYDSENALSVGASFHAGRATIVKMSVSDDSQNNVGYGAGMSVGW
ncbi:YadA C-terminal domain-containing protein [Rahnella sp. CFA14(1/10)]|uniref:YadA C-terminal domain-containing protein n=1 Tax=Rahnella sp. CFA14(1/10) TaxID=2511203 RepID=UPI001F1084BA|nr:YadA-like family protein [Rahnella sp. CFA14(1/10)]